MAQKPAQSEEDVKKNAKELFSNGEYSSALPLYSQLLSLYPKDADLSYRFGACKLFSEKDKEAPLTYLEFAVTAPNVEPEAFFFLGKAYHLNYRFDEALNMYRIFEQKGDSKSQQELLLQRHIAMCENGKKLLKNVTDIVVIEKQTLGKSDFFRNYNLSEFGGKIIKIPDEFKLAHDLKKKNESIMYLQPNADVVYFSSYGEEGKNGRDIYFAKKTPDGNWGKPQLLQGPVNTEFDEDYAFIHPNGTLYFASNGHNSMGGYDVFKSVFNEETQQWSYPQNIDFAINTPGDDYLYITDMDEKNAYFSSTRESSENEVTVYRVKVERIPVDITIIKGIFIADATKAAKITVEDLKDGKITGVYNTNANTGDYVLTVPNGGKFKFLVETAESSVTYTGMVDIPRQKTLKALKQEMQLLADNGEQRLIIKNIFDEEATEDVTVLLAEIYKEKATLEVNVDEIKEEVAEEVKEEIPEVKEEAESPEEKIKPSLVIKENISNDDIVKIAKEDATNAQKDASNLRLETEIAYSIANEKNRLSSDKANESEKYAIAAENSSDPSEKQKNLDKAKQSKKESKLYAEQAVAAYNIAKEIETAAVEKQKEADISFNYAQELENAVQQKSLEATAEKLAQLNEKLELQKSETRGKPSFTDYQKQIDEKRTEANTQTKLAEKLQKDAKELESDVSVLKQAAANEKKKKDKDRLMEQAFLLEKDLPAMQAEAFSATESAEKAQKELYELEKQESIFSSVVSQIRTSDKKSVTGLNETDKSKLESEISTIEDRITKFEEELALEPVTEEPLVSIVNTDEPIEKPEPEKSDSTEPVSADYENYYKQKIESSEAQTDEVKKEETKAQEYENWAKAQENEAAVLKQKATESADENEKLTFQEKAAELENSAQEKRKLSQESQATAAQLRLGTPVSEETTASNLSEPEKENIASYSQKYVSTEKDAMNIQDEKDKNVTLAEVNKQWADEISKEIETLKSEVDTIEDENVKTERQETIRLLGELKKEKESKAQLYTEKALETPVIAEMEEKQNETKTSPVEINESDIPADYSTFFESEIKMQEAKAISTNAPEQKIKSEEIKAEYYRLWANSIDKEIQQMKNESESVTEEEEKRSIEEKIVRMEMQSGEKRELSAQSTEQSKQLRQVSQETATSSSEEIKTPALSNEGVRISENPVSLQDRNFIEQMDNFQQQSENLPANKIENQIFEEEFKAELYRKWSDAIDNDVQQLKVLRDLTESESEKQKLENIIAESEKASKQKKAMAKESNEKAAKLKEESETATPEISEEKVKAEVEKTEAAASSQKAEELQTDATVKRYQADKMGFFKKKKKAAMLAEAQKSETESEINRESSELAMERAKLIEQSEKTELNDNLQKDFSYKSMESRAKSLESDALYLEDEAKATKDSLAIVKKKKQKDEIFAHATLLEQKAAAKRTEAVKFNTLASETKSKEESNFRDAFIKTIIDAEKKDSILPFAQTELSEEELETLKENETQKNFASKRKEYKKLYLQVEVQQLESAKMRNDAGIQLTQFGNVSNEAKTINDKNEREQYIKDALEFATQARNKLALADSLGRDSKSKEKLADTKSRSAIEELYAMDDMDLFGKIFAFQYLQKPEIPPAIVSVDTSQKDTMPEEIVVEKIVEAPAVIKETFSISGNAPVYNDKNPIPINPQYPGGLIWQVQIGAFRKPIPQNLFKGFAPIMGVKLNDDITRYSAGMFPTFANANSAKNEIVKLGYKDAFVVAYKNGQRISVAEARSLIAKGLIEEGKQPATDISVTPETTVASANTANNSSPADENPVEKIAGLFYTVQIGVYSKPATAAQLKNVKPVNSEKLENGTIRYSSGVYNDLASANNAKNKIVDIGIKDAFVTAYYNGKRISIAEAQKVSGGGSRQKPVTANIIFKVQLGVYSGDVPVNTAGAILELSRKDGNVVKENENTIYYAGNFKKFADAGKLKNEAVRIGLTEAIVVAFGNGEKMDLDEAMKNSNR